jgi:hypothetical protein
MQFAIIAGMENQRGSESSEAGSPTRRDVADEMDDVWTVCQAPTQDDSILVDYSVDSISIAATNQDEGSIV